MAGNAIRELVTVLRYQVDNSGLKEYKDAFNKAAKGVAAGQDRMRRGLRTSAGLNAGRGPLSPTPGAAPGLAPAAIPSAIPAIQAQALQGALKYRQVVQDTGMAYRRAGMGLREVATSQEAVIQGAQRTRGLFGRIAFQLREFGGGLAQGARQGFREWQAGQAAVTAGAQRHQAAVRKTADAYGSGVGFLKQIALTYGVLSTARIADEWASVEARVGLATDSVEDQKYALQEIFKIAQQTRQEYTTVGDLFAKVSRNRKELGLDVGQTLDLSKVIGQTMTIGGGSTASQEAALMQLGQSLGSGVLRGEELNSILEQAPRLAEAIAASFGVSVGQLKALGAAGKLTAKELVNGLLKQSEAINAEFNKMPRTFGGAMQTLKNEIGRRIHDLDKMTGAAEKFADAIDLIVKNLSRILTYIGLIAARWAFGRLLTMAIPLLRTFSRYWAMLLARTGSTFASLFIAARRLLWPWMRMALILEAIYLIGDDIIAWINGAGSITGDLIGPFEEWKTTLDPIITKLKELKGWIMGMTEGMGPQITAWTTIGTIIFGLISILKMLSGPIKFIWSLFMGVGKLLAWAGSLFMWLGGIIATVVTAIAGFLGLPVLLVAALIAALVAFAVYLYNYGDEFFAFWGSVLDDIFAFVGKVLNAMFELLDQFGQALGDLWDGVKTYAINTWNAIGDWIAAKIKWLAGLATDMIPDWVKSGASWVGGKLGIGAGDVQRAGSSGPVTVQTNVGDINVTAPNSNPTAIAAATKQGMFDALSKVRTPFDYPMVEAAP